MSCPWFLLASDSFPAWISMETIQLFWMESQRGGFWPRVRSLECCMDWDTAPFISSFFTPTIADLDLSFPDKNSWLLQPTLSLISHTCRQLQSLKIFVGTSGSSPGIEMGRLISASASTLHTIAIQSPTPPEILPVIFELPLLRSLKLKKPQFPDQIPSGILPSLELVSFRDTRGPNLTQFFGKLSTRKLVEVGVYYSETIQVPTLLHSLTGATATIENLSLSPVTALCRSSIALLCTFTNLTYLFITCACVEPIVGLQCTFQLTDQDLLDLGGALPLIHTLSLGPGCRTPCCATFKSLIGLSRTCGSLKSLSITVDFASIVDASGQQNNSNASPGVNSPRIQRGRSKLRQLNLGNSSLPGTPRCEWIVALALFTIFPSVDLVHSPHEWWGGVRRDILVCQRIFHAIEAEGKSLDTRSGIPTLMHLIQTRPQSYKLMKGSRLS